MRHGLTTLTQSPKYIANNGSILAHPPKKFKWVHSAGKVIASIFWDSQWVIMTDYLEQGRTVHIMQANLGVYARKLAERGKEN